MIATDRSGVARLAAIFANAKREGRAALIPFVVTGDPDIETTDRVVAAIGEAGADLVELGVPYGDPIADGPTIAAAAQRALVAGTRVDHALEVARRAHERGIATLLFTYLNPVLAYGVERFADALAASGAVGAIVPDVTFEEIGDVLAAFTARGLAHPLLIAPTTPAARAAQIASASDGFVYVVSRLGVTGARREPDVAWIGGALERIRTTTSIPLAVGFGISTPAHAAAVGTLADGVIVGSALVDAIAGLRGDDAARAAGAYVASLRAALPRRT